MPESVITSTNLSLAAKRLEGHLRLRGLRSGDRYLTVADAALMLGVSSATAHRAMDLLAREKLLVRERGRGTFVGTGIGEPKPAQVRTIFVLMPEGQRDAIPTHLEDTVAALRARLGGVSVQFSFIPTQGGVEYVRELIGTAKRIGHFAGVVAIACPRAIYRYLAETGGPTVVLGSLYADQRQLPSVDVDYRQMGHLLARDLIDKGHRRMALLLAGGGRPHDGAFFDGISDAMTEASLPHNALTVRIYPKDFDLLRGQVHALLQPRERPTGIICGTVWLVSVVESVALRLDLRIPRDIELVLQGQFTSAIERFRYVCAQPRLTSSQIAELVASMLGTLSDGKTLDNDRVVVPVEMREPETSRARPIKEQAVEDPFMAAAKVVSPKGPGDTVSPVAPTQ